MVFNKIRNATVKHLIALVELHGEIGTDLTFEVAQKLIDSGFGVGSVDAVVLEINSPGGNPQQTEQIANYIKEKSEATKIPVYSFVMDKALSGGYWVACTGILIYACGKLSTLGSIGVRIDTINVHRLMDKIGIEKKTITSGEKKVISDPYGEEDDDNSDNRLRQIAKGIHEVFKSAVEESRSDKLTKAEDPFSGDMWLAEKAVAMGLIDGICSFN